MGGSEVGSVGSINTFLNGEANAGSRQSVESKQDNAEIESVDLNPTPLEPRVEKGCSWNPKNWNWDKISKVALRALTGFVIVGGAVAIAFACPAIVFGAILAVAVVALAVLGINQGIRRCC